MRVFNKIKLFLLLFLAVLILFFLDIKVDDFYFSTVFELLEIISGVIYIISIIK